MDFLLEEEAVTTCSLYKISNLLLLLAVTMHLTYKIY